MLYKANLTKTNLQYATLVKTDFEDAILNNLSCVIKSRTGYCEP
ncbi:pentapeptide repeat-containing protein [Spirosoma sp. BT704]|uniref:Pentapeptide repeat-containing protein n=1 Tax=Spirosoma validum TaxID=2771355 RepID=A0A927B7D5_9BACT|nr:pentapeptide repeat-containing protein [Spirosoma validum]